LRACFRVTTLGLAALLTPLPEKSASTVGLPKESAAEAVERRADGIGATGALSVLFVVIAGAAIVVVGVAD
jgi:hypothetical protein